MLASTGAHGEKRIDDETLIEMNGWIGRGDFQMR